MLRLVLMETTCSNFIASPSQLPGRSDEEREVISLLAIALLEALNDCKAAHDAGTCLRVIREADATALPEALSNMLSSIDWDVA